MKPRFYRDFKSRQQIHYLSSIWSRIDGYFDWKKKSREHHVQQLRQQPVASPSKDKVLPQRFIRYLTCHNPLEYSSATRRERKLKGFLNECKATRNQMYNLRRGFWTCGLGNPHMNLGNELQICEKQDKRLDMDSNQSVTLCDKVFWLNDPLIMCTLHSVQKQHLTKSRILRTKFLEADLLVKSTFEARGIDADLSLVLEKGFTVDVCLGNGSVLGCVLYVLMRNYVWIEELSVQQEWRQKGIGSVLLNKIKELAVERQKGVLLYALSSAIPFYEQRGFKVSTDYSAEFKQHSGQYMVYKTLASG